MSDYCDTVPPVIFLNKEEKQNRADALHDNTEFFYDDKTKTVTAKDIRQKVFWTFQDKNYPAAMGMAKKLAKQKTKLWKQKSEFESCVLKKSVVIDCWSADGKFKIATDIHTDRLTDYPKASEDDIGYAKALIKHGFRNGTIGFEKVELYKGLENN